MYTYEMVAKCLRQQEESAEKILVLLRGVDHLLISFGEKYDLEWTMYPNVESYHTHLVVWRIQVGGSWFLGAASVEDLRVAQTKVKGLMEAYEGKTWIYDLETGEEVE